MMLSPKLEDELNKQINREIMSAYLYLSMSAYCEHINMEGFAKWMLIQSQEELLHAMKIFNYVRDREGRVKMLPIAQPQIEFSSLQQVFEEAVKNERDLAEKLNALASLAFENKDNTTYNFLDWFLSEQVEEIAITQGVLDKIKLVGDNGHGLLILNNELGSRVLEDNTQGQAA